MVIHNCTWILVHESCSGKGKWYYALNVTNNNIILFPGVVIVTLYVRLGLNN